MRPHVIMYIVERSHDEISVAGLCSRRRMPTQTVRRSPDTSSPMHRQGGNNVLRPEKPLGMRVAYFFSHGSPSATLRELFWTGAQDAVFFRLNEAYFHATLSCPHSLWSPEASSVILKHLITVAWALRHRAGSMELTCSSPFRASMPRIGSRPCVVPHRWRIFPAGPGELTAEGRKADFSAPHGWRLSLGFSMIKVRNEKKRSP